MKILLCSASPRRRELLTRAGYSVQVAPSNAPEVRLPGEGPVDLALRLAQSKCSQEDGVVLAADTVVHQGQVVFDKPHDRQEAMSHLRALSGAWHGVTTGVCLRVHGVEQLFSVTTHVQFRTLTEHEISQYVATGEADDKAGAYGIQGLGGAFVSCVSGSWTNVMGLPLEEVIRRLGGPDA